MKTQTLGSNDSKFVQLPMAGTKGRNCYASQLCSEVTCGLYMYDSLSEVDTDSNAHLKDALL